MSNNGLKAPPSFASFPDARPSPAFDSFPVASTSRSRSPRSGTEEERRERKRRKRELKDAYRDEDYEEFSKEERRAKRREDKEHHRSSRKNRDDTKVQERRHGKSSRRRSTSREDNTCREKRREARPEDKQKYYIAPDLVSGEVSTAVLGKSDDIGSSQQPDYKVYTVDRKGDQDVRRYGKPYKGSVPAYRRLGYGYIVGLQGEFKITKDSAYAGQGLDVVAGRDFTAAPRLRDRKTQLRITDRHYKRIALAPSLPSQKGAAISTMPIDDSFIPLARELTTRQKLDDLEHEEGQDYRSVAGLVKDKDLLDSDKENDNSLDEEEGGESYDEYLKRRNREFEKHLRQNPRDVKIWLDLVAYQDEVNSSLSSDASRSRKRILSTSERRSICEIKLSILERALQQPGNETSVELHLAIMREGSEIWDTAELMKRWQALLRSHPGEMTLWVEYVTFRQTRATVFTVQDTVDVYADCLSRLNKAALALKRGSQERQSLEENLVYLFLRVCLLLRQADYPERALAAFQAMIELNFHLPDVHKPGVQSERADVQSSSTRKALDDLELFWDMEAPRFGEEGARGWKNTPEDAEAPAEDVGSEVDNTERGEDDPFIRWAAEETKASQRRRRPTRTTDTQMEEDDPYSTVLFADIRPLLFIVSSPDARSQLIYSFLFYLGLPLTPPDTSTATPLASDTFLHSDDFSISFAPAKRAAFWPAQSGEEFLRSLIPFETIAGEAMEPVRLGGIKDPFQPPFRKFPVSPDLLFKASPQWFCLLDQKDHLVQLDLAFIRNALAQARLFSKDIFLTLAYFSLEASLNPKSAVKIAKRILKEDSNNLLLWDAYARIERSTGNLKTARTVYANALSLSQGFTEKERIDTPLLWRAWVEMEWEDGKPDAALAVLIASSGAMVSPEELQRIASGQDLAHPTPPSILKARQYYIRQLASANADDAPQSLFRHRISVTFCLALLEYLSQGLDVASATMSRQMTQLRNEARKSAEEEEAIALHAKILFRHTQSKTAFRPGQLREVLESALVDFPNNSVFLSLHLFNELRTRIENRVRRVLDHVILKEDSVTTEGSLFAIYAELHLNVRNYNAEAVRALFERAVNNTRTKSSLSIWSLYIESEVRQGKTRKAKGLLQRALVECPWAKELYMIAFSGSLRHSLRSAELKDIHKLMLEKGIRLHKRMEDYTAGWRSEESEEDDNEAAETEDASYAQRQAAERARLLPM